MAKKFVPMGNNILIEVDKAAEVTPGGIILTEDSRKKPDSGVVVACGGNVEILEVGDPVLFGKYVGTYIMVDGQERLLLHETDCLGYYEEVKE